MDFSEQEKRFGPLKVAEPKKKKGRGGFLSSLISEGGAAGGAASGAALGSIVPGVGTLVGGLVGAGLGGFLGGTGGKLLENKFRDDEFRPGEALKEGALSGVLSAVPIGGVGKAVKNVAKGGAKKATKEVVEKTIAEGGDNFLTKMTGKADDLTSEIAEAARSKATGTPITRAGERQLADVRGIGVGSKLDGAGITTQKQRELNNFLDYEVGATGALPSQIEKVENFRTAAQDRLSSLLRKNNYQVNNGELTSITKDAAKRIQKLPDFNPQMGKYANELTANLFRESRDLESLNDFRRGLDKIVNYARNEASPDPMKERVATALRKAIDSHLTGQLPEGKQIKSLMSKAYDSEKLMGDWARAGRAKAGNQGLAQRILDSGPVEAIQTAAGSRMAAGGAGGPGGVPGATKRGLGFLGGGGSGGGGGGPSILSRGTVGKELIKQGVGQSFLGGLVEGEEEQPQEDVLSMVGQDSEGIDLGQPKETSPFSRENVQRAVLQDIASTGGKNAATLVNLYKTFGADEENKLTAKQKEAQSKAKSLKGSIDLLSRNYETAGSGQGAGGVLSSILGRTPGLRSLGINEDAQVFEDQRKALIAPVARAISGEVGVLTDRDIARAEGLLPRLSDPSGVAQRKLENLYTLLGGAGGQEDEAISQVEELLGATQ